MDSKGNLGMRNWEFSDHTGSADNQAAYRKMSAYTDRDAGIGESNSEATSMNFSWVPHRNFLSSTKNVTHLSEMIDTPSMLPAEENTLRDGDHDAKPTKGRKQQHPSKRTNRVATKALRPKETKKNPSSPTKKKGGSASTRKHEKKNKDDDVERATIEFSGVPVPVCSCTGAPHQCYRWGAGGWQSSCCTTSISEYPLPMSSSRPSARLAGRKMSIGAYGKLLQRLAAEGQDLSYAVDLKEHWARHGTNKFVTIR